MEKSNETRFNELEAQCQDTEKGLKEIKVTGNLRHHETKGRLERMEKKKKTGYSD